MKHKKKLTALLAMFVLVAAFAACGGDPEQAPDTVLPPETTPPPEAQGPDDTAAIPREIVVHLGGDPFSFTPNFMPDELGAFIHDNLFSRLVKPDASQSEPVPDLSYRWYFSDDMLTLTFHLRQNAYWHDGVPVTSADVKYTFDTIAENPTYFFSSSMQIVDEIETPDAHTVIFHLNTPDASFPWFLGWYATHILPQHIYDIGIPWADNPAGQNPIGSGAFIFESYDEGESVVLARNPNHFEGPALLDRVIFAIIPDESTAVQALLNGEIDFMQSVPPASLPEVEAHPNINISRVDWPAPVRLVFNMEDEVAGNVAVRRAVAYALDRQQISNMAFFGEFLPEYTMYPSSIAWAANFEHTAPAQDVDAGIQVLEAAGFTRDADGYFLDLSVDVTAVVAAGSFEAAQLMQAQLSAVGIRLEINALEVMAYIMRAEAGEFQTHIIAGSLGPDPSSFVMRFGTGMATNWGRYSNLEFDELIRRGGAVADQAQRAIYYREAQRIMAEELPHLPLVAMVMAEASWDHFIDLPTQGLGRWGWTDWTFTDIVF